jgi:hypothetical protein
MVLAASHPWVPRSSRRASLAIVAVFALGCSVAGGSRPNGTAGAREGVAAAAVRPVRATCDGPEHDLGIEWEASVEAAMERGRREQKPVLIAFSARRQDHDFASEF